MVNETHDPGLRCWVESAHVPGNDFPIQNLPFGVFRTRGEAARIGVAIGDQILDLTACVEAGLLAKPAAEACTQSTLNALMALQPEDWSALRLRISRLLRSGVVEPALVPQRDVELLLPVQIGDYTDFYASLFHATNVGSMFRPKDPLLPNYKYVPVAYHGRSSSIVVSGAPVRRPMGQIFEKRDTEAGRPNYGPTAHLDYELEVGFYVGPGNRAGEVIPISEAPRHIFGFCLVNDWSARDIQTWEYQPLGPFLAKNFATTISPWVVTAEALEPFRAPSFKRGDRDPNLLPYLQDPADVDRGAIDIILEVSITSRQMRAQGMPPFLLSRGNFKDMYWTPAQMLAHHASNGCNLRPGDLIAGGTVSGPEKSSRGCLLELTWRGTDPLTLPTGETLAFLRDGDDILMQGVCRRDGFVSIGFGPCRGRIESSQFAVRSSRFPLEGSREIKE
jgi:fumarylacetoacetase